MTTETPAVRRCELGREEYGGDRYCYNHGGFAYLFGGSWCDKSPLAAEEKARRMSVTAQLTDMDL